MSEHHVFTISAVIIVLMIMLYMLLGLCLEKLRIPFGHEASLVLIIAGGISYLVY
jgi:hypothetical protein